MVRGLNAGAHELSRAELDGLIEFAQGQGAGGLVWALRRGRAAGWRSPIAKFLSDAERGRDRSGARGRARRPAAAGRRRRRRWRRRRSARCASSWRARFELVPDGAWKHHVGDRLPAGRVERRRGPLGCAAPSVHVADRRVAGAARVATRAPRGPRAYDLVVNGTELGGGSIRINRPEVQYRGARDARHRPRQRPTSKFGFLIEALKHGAPPHGGIALRPRPHRGAAGRARVDPRRDRVPEDGLRLGSAHRGPGPAGAGAAAGAGNPGGYRLAGAVRQDRRS